MLNTSVEPYLVIVIVPAISVLLGMAWSKVTSRRNRPFEPTLWFVVRWGYIFLFLAGCGFLKLDDLLQLQTTNHKRFQLSLICLALFAIVFVLVAAADWRRAVRKERASAVK